MNKIFTILTLSLLVSCSQSNRSRFDQLYQSRDYSGALAQGEIILAEQGTARDIWISIDSDARRANGQFLKKMYICADYQKKHFPSPKIDLLLLNIKSAIKTHCADSALIGASIERPVVRERSLPKKLDRPKEVESSNSKKAQPHKKRSSTSKPPTRKKAQPSTPPKKSLQQETPPTLEIIKTYDHDAIFF